jgi:hypothetical protein
MSYGMNCCSCCCSWCCKRLSSWWRCRTTHFIITFGTVIVSITLISLRYTFYGCVTTAFKLTSVKAKKAKRWFCWEVGVIKN